MTSSRFLFPAGLAVVAAAANYFVLQQATATTELVALRADLKPGEVITAAHMRSVPVRGDRSLFRGSVLFAERGSVEGMKVRRKVSAGELLLRADIENFSTRPDPTLIPEGHVTLTLPARKSVVITQPPPGKFVMLSFRRQGTSRESAIQQYGPYRLIGWETVTDPSGKETDAIQIQVAVPMVRDTQLDELRNQFVGGAPDALVALEVTQPFTAAPSSEPGQP